MSRFQATFLALIMFIPMLGPSLTLSAEEDHSGLNSELDIVYREQVIPLLRAYCWDCHSEDEDIVLNQDEAVEDLRGNRDVWIRAIAQLRNGTMPPVDGPELDADLRGQFVDLLSQVATSVDCVNDPNAGKVAMRRLNRYEYRNTIRDLTGVNYTPADHFPGDDVGYGFDNIGDVLSLPPL